MAIVKRYNGDSQGLVNVDRSRADAPAAKVISTGIGKHPTAYKIVGADFTGEMGVGGAVEAILRTIQVAGTTIAYQVDTVQLSVLCEATGWADDAHLQAAIVALGNRAADANVPVSAYDFTAVTVSSTGGIRLA
jgi:hypothetical protein